MPISTYTLVILFFVLMPTVGWAETCPMWAQCKYNQNGEVVITYPLQTVMKDRVVTCNEELTKCWTPCEVKMREAMKVMNPYLGEHGKPRGKPYSDMTGDELVKLVDGYKRAWKQWDQVMQSCVEEVK